MGVDEPPPEPRQELLAHDLHESGGDDEVGLVGGHGLGESGVPLLAGPEVLDPAHEGGDLGPLGTGEPFDAVPVGPYGHDLGAVGIDAGVRDGVEESLQVRTGSGDQDDEALGHGLGGHGGALSRGSTYGVAGLDVGLYFRTNASRPRIRGSLRSSRPSATIPAHRAAPTGRGRGRKVASGASGLGNAVVVRCVPEVTAHAIRRIS